MRADKRHPPVYVEMLDWSGWADTADCLSSVEILDYQNHELVVVYNRSTDGWEIKLRDAYPGSTVLQTGENLGFASRNKVGTRYALGKGADYMWLLKYDAAVGVGPWHAGRETTWARRGL